MFNNNDDCMRKRCFPNNCFIIGPTGPTGPIGPGGGATGATART